MPKTYSQDKKEKWLEKLSQGKSTKQIARESNADERTVKQAIKDIKSKAAAQQALTQMYQEALRNHMNVLNSAIIEILKELEWPSPFMPYFDWHNVKSQEALLQFEQENKSKETKTANVEADPFSDRALLAEHLKNSRAWRALFEWQRNLKKHRFACGLLQKQTTRVISEKCAMKEYHPGANSSGPLLYVGNTGDFLCSSALKYLLARETMPDLKKDIDVDLRNGVVRHHNAILAEGIKESKKAIECKDDIIQAFDVVKASKEAVEVVNLFIQIEKDLPKVKNELRAINALGIVTGQCRVCRQFSF